MNENPEFIVLSCVENGYIADVRDDPDDEEAGTVYVFQELDDLLEFAGNTLGAVSGERPR